MFRLTLTKSSMNYYRFECACDMVRLEAGQNAGPASSVFPNTRLTPSNFTAVGEMSDLALERNVAASVGPTTSIITT